MRKRRIWRYWLVGAVMTATLFAVLYLVSNFRYENSDDGLLLKAFMGFEAGQPTNFTLYTHTLLAWLLYGIQLLFPGVAWFSLLQLALLYFSCTVLVKSMLQLAARHGGRSYAGVWAGAIFLAVFAAFACCRITYTTTAALAGAAAVAQIMTADLTETKGGPILRTYLLGLFLLVCAYCLRDVSVLPPLAFIALASLWMLAEQKKAAGTVAALRRPLLTVLVVFLAVFAVLTGVRQAEIGVRGLRPYLDWQLARIELMDYTNFQNDPEPALGADSGLSAPEVEMVRQWYFLDGDIDQDALTAMANAYDKENPTGAVSRLTAFFARNSQYCLIAILLALLGGLCWTGRRKTYPLAGIAAVLALAGSLILFIYLVWRGRLIGRAADTVLMPCAALLFGLALLKHGGDSGGWKWRRLAALLLALLVLSAAAAEVRLTYRAVTRAPDTLSMQREDELEQYALENPQTLVVRSPNLLRDTRLLPDVSAGVPGNILLWGDWGCRTPNWYRQLEQFGFQGETFSAKDWLTDRIQFAASAPEDVEALQAYLANALGAPVEALPCGTSGTLTFYRFQTE